MTNPLVELRQVSKVYPMGETKVKALRGVSLAIFPGDLVSIVGASGSGKSTLLHLLGLLDRPSQGKIIFNRRRVDSLSDQQLAKLRSQTIGFVFQSFNLLSRTSVLDNVLLPVWYHPHLQFSTAKQKARKLLAEFGLSKRIDHFPNQLSGGEQQRVAIARALICDPQLILADEPTGNLDSQTGKEIAALLVELNRRYHKTVVLVTHDLHLAKVGKKKIYLSDGQIIKEEQ